MNEKTQKWINIVTNVLVEGNEACTVTKMLMIYTELI